MLQNILALYITFLSKRESKRQSISSERFYRDSESVVFNSGQKMALRAFYFIRALTKALTYYYISRSQRHLQAAVGNNWSGVPIDHPQNWPYWQNWLMHNGKAPLGKAALHRTLIQNKTVSIKKSGTKFFENAKFVMLILFFWF